MANNPSDPRYLTQFVSFKVIELVTDTDDRKRVALSRHRMESKIMIPISSKLRLTLIMQNQRVLRLGGYGHY